MDLLAGWRKQYYAKHMIDLRVESHREQEVKKIIINAAVNYPK